MAKGDGAKSLGMKQYLEAIKEFKNRNNNIRF